MKDIRSLFRKIREALEGSDEKWESGLFKASPDAS